MVGLDTTLAKLRMILVCIPARVGGSSAPTEVIPQGLQHGVGMQTSVYCYPGGWSRVMAYDQWVVQNRQPVCCRGLVNETQGYVPAGLGESSPCVAKHMLEERYPWVEK